MRDLGVMALGLGAATPVFTLAVQTSVDVRSVRAATGLLNLMRALGAALGAAIAGNVIVTSFASANEGALPIDVSVQLTPPVLAMIQTPRVLLHGDTASTLTHVMGGLGPQAQAQLPALLTSLRGAVLASTQSAVMFAGVALVIAVVLGATLRSLQLHGPKKSAAGSTAKPTAKPSTSSRS
jgi:hypothetical protein